MDTTCLTSQRERHEPEFMNQALRYPLYLIANDQGVLVASTGGKDCVLLFQQLGARRAPYCRGQA